MEKFENQEVALGQFDDIGLIAKLVSIRKRRNLSQREVARRLGIDASNLCNYERGKTCPSLLVMVHWCKVLNCSLLVATNVYPDFSDDDWDRKSWLAEQRVEL